MGDVVFKATDYGSTCPTGGASAWEICTEWEIKLPAKGNRCPPNRDDCYVTMCTTVISEWTCSGLQAFDAAKAFCQNILCPKFCPELCPSPTTAADDNDDDDDDDGNDADSLQSGITNDSQYTTGVTIAAVASVSVIVIIAVVVIVALLRQRPRQTTESLPIHSQDAALVQ